MINLILISHTLNLPLKETFKKISYITEKVIVQCAIVPMFSLTVCVSNVVLWALKIATRSIESHTV